MTRPQEPQYRQYQAPIEMPPDLVPEDAANRILVQYWDDDVYPVDPYAIAKKLGIQVYVGSLPADISGMYRMSENGQEIFVERSDHDNRRRFTVGHEIGHAIRNPQKWHMDRKRDGVAAEGTDGEEIYANRFSAALLMPRFAVQKLVSLGWDVTSMSNFFGVSNLTMENRLKNLGYA